MNTRRSDRSENRFVWAALVLVGALLFVIQYTTLPRIRAAVLAGSEGQNLKSVKESAVSRAITAAVDIAEPVDYVVLLGLAALLLVLCFREATDGALSRFLVSVEAKPRAQALLLLLVSIMATRYYLSPGDVFVADAESYGVRVWMVADSFRHGQWPVWSNYWYQGYPLLHYYAPLYYLLVAAVALLVDNIHTATKLVLWITHIASIYAMFYFLRSLTRDFYGALVGALAFAIVFYRINLILYNGDFIQSLILLAYPAMFLVTEKYLTRSWSTKASFAAFALVTAALVVSHHGYAFFGIWFYGVYAVIRLAMSSDTGSEKLRALSFIATSGLFGVLIGAVSLLPFVLEGSDVRGMPGLPFDHLVPIPPPLGLAFIVLKWAPTGMDVGTFAYIGISLSLIALLASVYLVWTRNAAGIALVVCAVYTLCTVRGGSHYNTKNLSFFVFFLCVLSAYAPAATSLLLGRLRSSWPAISRLEARIAVVLGGLLILDFGPMTFQYVYMPDYYDFQDAMYARVLKRDPSYRVLERRVTRYDPSVGMAENFDTFRLGIISAYAPLQTPLGRFHEGTARSLSYNSELVKKMQLDLNEAHLSEEGLDGLYLMAVKFVLFRDRSHYFSPPIEPSVDYTIEDSILELRQVRPLIVSKRLRLVEELPGYDQANPIEANEYFDPDMLDYEMPYYDGLIRPLLQAMHIDRASGTADALLVRGARPAKTELDGERDIELEVLDYTVSLTETRLRYVSDAESFGRVSLSYYPYLDVRVDGEPVPFQRSAMHNIIVELPEGEHWITVRGRASRTRRWTLWLSLASLVGSLVAPRRFLKAFNRAAAG